MWIETDSHGLVSDASEDGARMFNLTPKGLRGRDALLFFPNHRALLAHRLKTVGVAADGDPLSLVIWPRERKPRPVTVTLTGGDGRIVWRLRQSAPESASDTPGN
jgi:hypothetical protein